jgi:hypothetical protein
MMQLARRASLIVVGLLLASVGTASAECAWVLWVGPSEKNPEMRIMMSAFPKAEDCHATLASRCGIFGSPDLRSALELPIVPR